MHIISYSPDVYIVLRSSDSSVLSKLCSSDYVSCLKDTKLRPSADCGYSDARNGLGNHVWQVDDCASAPCSVPPGVRTRAKSIGVEPSALRAESLLIWAGGGAGAGAAGGGAEGKRHIVYKCLMRTCTSTSRIDMFD